MKILGIDPGKVNTGWCVLEYSINRKLITKPIAHGMIKNPINTLVGIDAGKKCRVFEKEVRTIIKKYGVESVVTERFQTRGNGGPLIEYVGVMLGIISTIKGPVREQLFITASQWKNRILKIYDLKKEVYPMISFTNHQMDASLIALYGVYQLNNLPNHYKDLVMEKWINQMEKCTLVR